ncbi:glycosyltransferase family 4 protein [Geofilum sp. OHC36d9]|uniref:glycosyltransferase family 4 protein n=1 Tax=Geofilum sp. OHC36d9 TaxID=3458413 RepID=UPI00403461E2
MKINHNHSGYPEKRNFLYIKEIRFTQTIDLFKIISHLSFKILKTIPVWSLNLYYTPYTSSRRVIHLFNGLCLSHQHWVTTFETILPRLGKAPGWLTQLAVKKMAKPNCIKLIALSSCNYHIQKQYLEQYWPKIANTILKKTVVLHPPQAIFSQSIEKKQDIKKEIIFTFVGNDFFRKGGKEILNVFEQLAKESYLFQLNIISNFTPDQYASHTTIKDVNDLKQRFTQLSPMINIKGSLPNDKVIEILKQTHVALLPTYADTYGYFVLESQACGCPVITSDIRALPEINNDQCGWIINVPKDKNGNGILLTKSDREKFSQIITDQLYNIIQNIFSNPEVIKPKAEMSLKRIQTYHDPQKHAQQLLNIYRNALQ